MAVEYKIRYEYIRCDGEQIEWQRYDNDMMNDWSDQRGKHKKLKCKGKYRSGSNSVPNEENIKGGLGNVTRREETKAVRAVKGIHVEGNTW